MTLVNRQLGMQAGSLRWLLYGNHFLYEEKHTELNLRREF